MNILKKISLLTIISLALMDNNLHCGNKFRLEAIKAYTVSFKEKSQCAWNIMRNLTADDVRLIMAIAKEQAEDKLQFCKEKMHVKDFIKSSYFKAFLMWSAVRRCEYLTSPSESYEKFQDVIFIAWAQANYPKYQNYIECFYLVTSDKYCKPLRECLYDRSTVSIQTKLKNFIIGQTVLDVGRLLAMHLAFLANEKIKTAMVEEVA